MFDNMSAIILTQQDIQFMLISRYFGIGSDSFYFLRLQLSLLDIKIRKKRKKGKPFGHIWGPSSAP